MPTPTEISDYAHRYVAFVDILGFTAAIRKIDAVPATYDSIRKAQTVMRKISRDPSLINIIGSVLAPDPQITAFSDCIVVSASDDPMSLWYVADVALDLCRLFLSELGLLTRGGIGYGRLHHKEGTVFGLGMIDAYELERDVARHPRVVLPPHILAAWRAATDATPVRAYHDLVVQDDDGVHYIDLFHRLDSKNETEKRFFKNSRSQLDSLLRQPTQRLRDWTKVVWLANRFNETVAREKLHPAIEIPEFPGRPA